MTDTKNPKEISTIARKLPDMTQNSNKIALFNEPGWHDPSSNCVELYANIMTVLTTKKQNSSNAVESYTKNLTPPPNNKQNFSQIVHLNDKKTMHINKHHKMPPTNAKDPPTVTGSDCCKSARINAAGSGSELKVPQKLSRTFKSSAFSTSIQ
jgi:hypothetical protein